MRNSPIKILIIKQKNCLKLIIFGIKRLEKNRNISQINNFSLNKLKN